MSVYYDLLQHHKTTLLTMEPFNEGTIDIRKELFVSRDVDTFPLTLIIPGKEVYSSGSFGNKVYLEYPIYIVVINQKSSTLSSDDEIEWMYDRREELRDAFWKTRIVSISEIMDCGYDPYPAFDVSAIQGSFDISVQSFHFKSREDRAI